MKPEEKARAIIDRMFEEAGWKVVDRDKYVPNMTAVAIREGLRLAIGKPIIYYFSTAKL